MSFSLAALKQQWTTWTQCLEWSSRWTTTLRRSRSSALPCLMKTSVPRSSTNMTSWENSFAHWEWYGAISPFLLHLPFHKSMKLGTLVQFGTLNIFRDGAIQKMPHGDHCGHFTFCHNWTICSASYLVDQKKWCPPHVLMMNWWIVQVKRWWGILLVWQGWGAV